MRFDKGDVIGVWVGTHGTPADPYPFQWFPSDLEAYYSASKCIKTVISDSPPASTKVDVEGAWWIQVRPERVKMYQGIQKCKLLARLVLSQVNQLSQYALELKKISGEIEELL